MKQSGEVQSMSAIIYRVDSVSEVQIKKMFGVESLAALMVKFESDGIEDYDEWVAALERFEYRSKLKRLDLDIKNRESLPAKPSIEVQACIEWTIEDIIGIPLRICSHNIQLMLDHKLSIEHQRILNPPKKEVVQMEIIKWLDASVIYPIADRS